MEAKPLEAEETSVEATEAAEAEMASRTARTLSEIAAQEGFQETSDPALQESAERGKAKLLSYKELYLLWERQQWATQELDFSQDRIDWHERIPDEERFQRMYGLSGFFIGGLAERLRETEEHLNESFGQLFDGLLHERVDRLAAEPEDTEALVEVITLYHMIIEGALALTGQHFIIEYNTEQNTLPAFVEGFNKVARDEHRHIAFGVRFLTDMAQEDDRYRDAIQRMMAEALPIADGVLDPPWAEEDDWELFGYSRAETHAFAAQSLTRRLKVIGLG
jgi:ribonucleoside-diphosphate reductase beta chain